jgi:sporulation protein YlmC with PRC-barrel domain
LDLIYDDKIRIFGPLKKSPGLQTKSIIGIGYSRILAVKKKIIVAKPKPATFSSGE